MTKRIICDHCEINPGEYMTARLTIGGRYFFGDDDLHFCSLFCLSSWASEHSIYQLAEEEREFKAKETK